MNDDRSTQPHGGAPADADAHTYKVHYIRTVPLDAAGLPDVAIWQQANLLTDFCYPWEDSPAPFTEFCAFISDKSLFFRFHAINTHLVIDPRQGDKMVVLNEDRVEIFLAADDRLARYYGLEIDPLGRVMDYRAAYYRQFEYDWTMPGLQVAAQRTADGYTVTGTIPLKTMRDLQLPDLLGGQPLFAGVFRGDFRRLADGRITRRWISWIDPCTDKPDFHVPSAFGRWVVEP